MSKTTDSTTQGKLITKKRVMIVVLVVVLALVGLYLWKSGLFLKQEKLNPVDSNQKLVATLPVPTDGSSAIDYNVVDNFRIAAQKLNDAKSFEVNTTGLVKASIVDQDITARRIIKDGQIFYEAISSSAYVKKLDRYFFDLNGANNLILYQKGTDIKNPKWSDVIEIAKGDFDNSFGYIPQEICYYDIPINNSTIDDAQVITEQNGQYIGEITFNQNAVEHYKTEIMVSSGSKTIPDFSKIKLRFIMDYEWNLQKIEKEEAYQILKAGVGNVNCSVTFEDVFSNVGTVQGFPSEVDPFFEFVPNGETGKVENELTIIDYLQMAFGEYLDLNNSSGIAFKEPINAKADINAFGTDLALSLGLDLNNNIYNIKINDRFFISYQEGLIYLNADKVKVRLNPNNVLNYLDISTKDLASGQDLNNVLEDILNNGKITKNGDNVAIDLNFELFSIKFDIKMNLVKTEDDAFKLVNIIGNVDLGSIKELAQLNLKSNIVGLTLTLDKSIDFELVDDSYVSLDSFIDSIFAIVKSDSININATVTVDEIVAKVTANVSIKELAVVGKLELLVDGQTVKLDLQLKDNIVYVVVGNIKLKADLNNLEELATAISDLTGLDIANELNTILEESVNTLNLGEILDEILKGLVVTDNKITVNYSGVSVDVTVDTANENAIVLATNNIDVNGLALQLSASVKANKTEVNFDVNDNGYVEALDLIPYVKALLKLVDMRSGELSINGELNSSYIPSALNSLGNSISGNLAFDFNNDLKLGGSISAFSQDINLACLNNIAYVALNSIKLKVNTNDVNEILEKITSSLPSGLNDLVLPSIELALDINKILDSLKSLSLDNSGLSLVVQIDSIEITLKIKETSLNSSGLEFNISVSSLEDSTINASLTLGLSNINGEQGAIVITEPTDASDYVDVNDLADFIAPLLSTVEQEKFDITFSGDVENIDGKYTYFDGRIKVETTTKISNASFPNLELTLNLGENTTKVKNGYKHQLKLLMIKNEQTSDVDIYANYNGLKIKLSYNVALKIVGAVVDILNLEIPPLDAMLEGIYDPNEFDTTIFESMNIVGLNELRDSINSLFTALESADGGQSQFEEVINDLLTGVINEALHGISLGLDNNGNIKTLTILVNNSAYGAGGDGISKFIISHDGSLLTGLTIEDIDANDNNVNVDVTLNTTGEFTLSSPTSNDYKDAMDFNTIYSFLGDFINTANVKEFDIAATLGMKFWFIDIADISVEGRVKVLDDGSTVAALNIKSNGAAIPVTGQMIVEPFNSSIYFYDNILYLERTEFTYSKFLGAISKRTPKKVYRVAVEPSEFLSNLMDYILFVFPLGSYVTDQITSSTGGDTPKEPIKIEQVLKGYEASGNNYTLKLGLKELAQDDSLGDATIKFTRLLHSSTNKHYFSNLTLETTLTQGLSVDVNLKAELKNLSSGTIVSMRTINTTYITSNSFRTISLYDNSLDNYLTDPQFAWGSNLSNKVTINL